MSTIMSTGQITLVDLTDSRPSSFYLQANQSKIQVYDVNNKTYSPDYTVGGNLIITPFFFLGNEDKTTLLNSTNLTYTINGTLVNNEFNGAVQSGNILTINKNIGDFNETTLRIEASIKENSITDPETGLTIESVIKANIEIAKIDTGEKGTNGIGISDVIIYYNSNNSPSTPPTIWETDLSKVGALSANNKYLWSYQTTKYTSGAEESTIPAIIGTYGDTGATGAAGTSVKSITEQYYISTSKTEPTGSNWTSTPPASLETNKFLWTRTEIVYLKADTTTYTEYKPSQKGICDFTWNLAIEEVTKTTAALSTLQNSYDSLQKQVDGAIDTWYGEGSPTDENWEDNKDNPSKNWTTDKEKINHNGDLYYNTKTGQAYRYTVVVDSNNNVSSVSWVLLTDDALANALKEIQDIGAEVDGKMTIYYNEPSDIPSSANVGDLWIQGKDGDYYKCIQAYTSKPATITNYWVIANQNVGKIDILFAKGDSSVEPPSSTEFTTNSPEWEQGKYIWQKTAAYAKDGTTVLYETEPVCITSASRSIESVVNYYLASAKSSGVTTEESGWESNISNAVLNKDKPYLWNYEKVNYTYGKPDVSTPIIIGNFSVDGTEGRGIKKITEYYLVNNDGTKAPSFAIDNSTGIPTSNIWKTEIQITSDEAPYLWNAEVIEYTTGPNLYEAKLPQLIGYRGVGIDTVKTYYKTNNSSTTPPTSWDDTWTDVDADNQFLWSYTETTYTDGTHSESTPAIIARYTVDGAPAIFAIVETNDRTFFSDTNETAITLNALLYEGGKVIQAEKYAWTAIDSDTPNVITGNTNKLIVNRTDVLNIRTFICTMTYKGVEYSDRISISDKTDPVYCIIESSAGDKFTNKNISTILTCRVFSGDGEKDTTAPYIYTYNWEKYNANGVKDNNFSATGKTLEIGSSDVDKKSIFSCTVTK